MFAGGDYGGVEQVLLTEAFAQRRRPAVAVFPTPFAPSRASAASPGSSASSSASTTRIWYAITPSGTPDQPDPGLPYVHLLRYLLSQPPAGSVRLRRRFRAYAVAQSLSAAAMSTTRCTSSRLPGTRRKPSGS